MLSSKASSPGTPAPPLGLLGASSGLMEVCAACHVLSACAEELLDSRETQMHCTCLQNSADVSEGHAGLPSLLQGQPKPG